MEDTFYKMLSALQEYANDGYPNCPSWNEGAWCPDCENECHGQVDGFKTVLPWATCSPVYVGGGLEVNYLDENYAWECESYCTDPYNGEIPEGVTYNRAERQAQTTSSGMDISAIIGVTLGVAVVGAIALALWFRRRRTYESLDSEDQKRKQLDSILEDGDINRLTTEYGAASQAVRGNQKSGDNTL